MATEDAAHAMNLFYEELNALYSDIAKRSGLSGSAFDILYALHEEDGRRMVDLCRASFMSKQTLASSVRRLEEQGLVRTEARSRRFVRVFLTDQGRAQVEAAIVPIARAETRALERLSPAEQRAIPELIAHYLEALRAEFGQL